MNYPQELKAGSLGIFLKIKFAVLFLTALSLNHTGREIKAIIKIIKFLFSNIIISRISRFQIKN